jgi:hypothetical protein
LKGRAIRVCFESLDGAGITAEESSAAADAVAIATSAFRKHQLQLAPLFVTIAGIKAKRAGPQQPNGSSRP